MREEVRERTKVDRLVTEERGREEVGGGVGRVDGGGVVETMVGVVEGGVAVVEGREAVVRGRVGVSKGGVSEAGVGDEEEEEERECVAAEK